MTGDRAAPAVRLAERDDLPRLEPLWVALYEHQRANGMFLELPPDAFVKWESGLRPLLGRFATVVLAEEGDAIVGFVACRIRALPPYFGGGTTGFVSDVFVADSQRGRGVGELMMRRAEEWFAAQQIRRLELQVIVNNSGAHRLYERLGWRDELVQMVKEI